MDRQSQTAAGEANVVRLHTPAARGPELNELAEQAFRVAIGLGTVAAAALTAAIARTLGHEPASVQGAGIDEEEALRADGLPVLAGAALGVTLEGGRWVLQTAAAFADGARPWLSFALSPRFVRHRVDDAWTALHTWDDRWQETRPRDEDAASAFVKGLVPEVVDAALDQIDLTHLVLERVDLERIIERIELDEVAGRIDIARILDRVDLDDVVRRVDIQRIMDRVDLGALVERLPLEEIVARIDVDEIVARLDVERIVERVDLNKVAERLDVDSMVARMDLDGMLARIDLVGIAQYVIDEIDLPEIIRGSTGTMATETVEGIRVQGMNADRLVSRLVDRALRRQSERDTEAPTEREDEL
jgi:hypothetical protein